MQTEDPIIEPDLSVREPITFPEFVFNQVFKDFFNSKEKSSDDVTLLKWLEIAGNVYTPVNLVDENGNVVGVVPPILNRASISKDVNIVGMTHHYDLLRSRHAGSASKHLENMTKVISENIVVEPTYTKLDWEKVNPNKDKEEATETKPKKKKPIKPELDDIVYD